MPPAPPVTQRDYWNGKAGEEWAAQSDRTDRMLAPLNEAVLDVLKLKRGEHVLDIGCGAGATAMEIAAQAGPNGQVVGVDVSRPLLGLARRRAAEKGLAIAFAEVDAGAEPIPGAPFDAAFSRFGVMFFTEPTAAFAHMRGALRRGGRLAFVCWRPMQDNLWATAPLEAVTPMLKSPLQPPDPDAPGPYAFADADKVRRILNGSGWRDVVIDPWQGELIAGGGGGPLDAADFVMRIGPCARAIADQELDRADVQRRIAERLAPYAGPNGVSLPAACWIVRAAA